MFAKYVWDLGGRFKDAPSSKLTFYGGLQRAELTNPESTVAVGSTTIGGYVLAKVNNTPFGVGATRTLDTAWAGAKYELPTAWSFTGAWYTIHQDEFKNTTGKNCAGGTVPALGNKTPANCAGDSNTASFVIDYAFSKHFDLYTGVSYSDVDGGLASGFLANHTTAVVSGMRLRF